MNDTKKIIFISSYPKSGNTWLRCLIGALLNKQKGNFSFDNLKYTGLFSRESNFIHFKNLKYQENGNINFNFLSNHWISAQQKINKDNNKIKFFKTHSIRKIYNKYFTDETVCLGFIYIFRDPRDIAISYTHHCGSDLDVAIKTMLYNEKNYSSYYKANELISTWKNHLYSWNHFKTVPSLFIKYEDMLLDTRKILIQIIYFLKKIAKLEFHDDDLIKNILKSTSFKNLQEMENSQGFGEATDNNPFFRKGTAEQWQSVLTKDQLNLIENELKIPMHHLGYLK